MTSLRQAIADKLKENRPKLGASSIGTYVSILVALPKKMDDTADDVGWFQKNEGKILSYFEDKPAAKRKTTLSALYAMGGSKKVHEQMLEDARSVNEAYKSQKVTAKEAEHWMSWEDIQNRHAELETECDPLWRKKSLTPTDILSLTRYVLLSCYVLFPPRRSQDWGLMRLGGEIDKDEDNYVDLKKRTVTFNKFKTFATYGKQVFPLRDPLLGILRRWSKVIQAGPMLRTTAGTPMTANSVGKHLNAIFAPKRVSVDLIRHAFLTHFYGGQMPAYSDMEMLSKMMGHSVNTALSQYVKRDAPSDSEKR